MTDTTAGVGLSTYAGRQIQAEYISPTSSIIGKSIDTITIQIRKGGAPTGTAQVGIFNDDLTVKKLFATVDPALLTTIYTNKTYSLTGESYTISSGDRIGIKYTGGDTSNFVAIMTDNNAADPFDGTNSYHTHYTSAWNTFTANDLFMILKGPRTDIGPTVTASPAAGTYTSALVTLTASVVPSTIYYTLDGTTPTTSSPTYSTPILISTNSTLKYFAIDTANNSGNISTSLYTITISGPITYMSDTTESFGISTNTGRPIQAEYVSPTSVLVGKSIDTITVKLQRTGSPSGTMQVGIFNDDKSVKQLFGTASASSIATSYTAYSYSLPGSQTYKIQAGDRIGIKFVGGDINNYIGIMTDQINSFDGTKTYMDYSQFVWTPLITKDYYMILKLTHFTPPTITINGANPITVEKNSAYVDMGAKAIDIPDGNLTSSIITSSNVNANTLGTYSVNYTITNSHGLSSLATRTVNVVPDFNPPVITINGANPAVIQLNSAYVDAGATALDAVNGVLTGSIITQNTVNTSVAGNYTVTYTVTDSTSHTAQEVRTVTVRSDTTPPVITLKGSNPLTIGSGVIYLDPGVTALDNIDGDLVNSVVTTNPVNTAVVGSYVVTYNVSDKIGNAATQVTRTVNVVSSPITAMNDITNTYGLGVHSGRQIQAEYVSPTSSLVGKTIDTITVKMQRNGNPTGTLEIGVFNTDKSVKKLFGTIDSATVAGIYTSYTLSLAPYQYYQIQSGDRIGVKLTGGDSSNYITIMSDQSNTFDGTNSYQTDYTTTWNTSTGVDLTLVLKQVVIPSNIPVVTPPTTILSVTTNSTRNITNLGSVTAFDSTDPSPIIQNNSTGIFPIGNTTIAWRATDSQGNIGIAYQTINVIKSPSVTASTFNKVAMINFDDGYLSVNTLAKPILDKYNIKTTQYIVCGSVNTGDYMSWNMLNTLQSQGHDIQAHTMTHAHSNVLSQARLNYEYGQSVPCLTNNGTSGVHMVAMPFNEGFNNATVINTISNSYDMARGGNDPTFFLHCNNFATSTQANCTTFKSPGVLNSFNKYSIRSWSHDLATISTNYNDGKSFSKFLEVVNAATTNTSSNSTEVPIIYYHRMVLDNGPTSTSEYKGTTTALFDAEMKYLADNNFKIWTTDNFGYDNVNNRFFMKP